MTTVWRIRAWQDPELEQRFLRDGLIALSADELGDLSSEPTDAELAELLEYAHPDRTPKARAMFVRSRRIFLRSRRIFLTEMAVGDHILLALDGRKYALGVVTGPYHYRADEADRYVRHTRRVQWLRTGDRNELPEPVRRVVNAPGTLCRVRDPSGLQL